MTPEPPGQWTPVSSSVGANGYAEDPVEPVTPPDEFWRQWAWFTPGVVWWYWGSANVGTNWIRGTTGATYYGLQYQEKLS